MIMKITRKRYSCLISNNVIPERLSHIISWVGVMLEAAGPSLSMS